MYMHTQSCSLPLHSMNSSLHIVHCDVGLGVTVTTVEFGLQVGVITWLYGVISTVYTSPGCTPNIVTLFLLTVIGDWSELTL